MTHPVVDIPILKIIILTCTGTLWMTCFILDDWFKVTEIHILVIKHFQPSPSLTKVLPFTQKVKIIAIIPTLNYLYFLNFCEYRVAGVHRTTNYI